MYVLVSPCVLSEKFRANGITTNVDRGVWSACVERCECFGIEMVPLPCPETEFLGIPRTPASFLDRLNTPDFFQLMDELEKKVRDYVAERKSLPIAILGVNSSPTCGVTSTYYSDEKSLGPGKFLERFSDIAPLIDVREFAKYKIYLAAPLFSEAEKRYNTHIAKILSEFFYEVHLPQNVDDTAEFRECHREEDIYTKNIAALLRSDIIVGVIDGSDADSGTSWEMGYATALEKRVIALRTDFRKFGDKELVNLMLEEEAEVVRSEEELTLLLRF